MQSQKFDKRNCCVKRSHLFSSSVYMYVYISIYIYSSFRWFFFHWWWWWWVWGSKNFGMPRKMQLNADEAVALGRGKSMRADKCGKSWKSQRGWGGVMLNTNWRPTGQHCRLGNAAGEWAVNLDGCWITWVNQCGGPKG